MTTTASRAKRIEEPPQAEQATKLTIPELAEGMRSGNLPAVIEIVAPTTEIEEYRETASGLALLAHRMARIVYDTGSKTGMEQARTDRRELVTLRTSLQAKRKEVKAGILAKGKLIDSEAARIEAEILLLEEPIDIQIKNEERRKEEEKQERDRVERERVGEIRAAINKIVQRPIDAIGLNVAGLDRIIGKMVESPPTVEVFQELMEEATAGYNYSLQQLREARGKKAIDEEAQAKLKADQEQLAQQQAAENERQRLAREEEERRASDAKAEQQRLDDDRQRRQWIQSAINEIRMSPAAAIGQTAAAMRHMIASLEQQAPTESDHQEYYPGAMEAWHSSLKTLRDMAGKQQAAEEANEKAETARREADRIAEEARKEADRKAELAREYEASWNAAHAENAKRDALAAAIAECWAPAHEENQQRDRQREAKEKEARDLREKRLATANRITALRAKPAMANFMTAAGEYRVASDEDANDRMVELCAIYQTALDAAGIKKSVRREKPPATEGANK
jgi:colicin import membrane protein